MEVQLSQESLASPITGNLTKDISVAIEVKVHKSLIQVKKNKKHLYLKKRKD